MFFCPREYLQEPSMGAQEQQGCQVPVLTEQRPGPLHRASEQKNPDLNVSLVFFSWQELMSTALHHRCAIPFLKMSPSFSAGLQMRLSNWPG